MQGCCLSENNNFSEPWPNDIDDWPQVADAFRVGPIPVFFQVDAAGNPTGRSIDGNAWGENVPANMAPPLKQFFQAR